MYASQSAGGGLGVQIAGDSRPDIITASGGGRRSTVGGAQRVHGELATLACRIVDALYGVLIQRERPTDRRRGGGGGERISISV